MLLIDSERALTQSFRPRDQRVLELPADMQFPLIVRGYHAWVDPTGVRTFLVFEHESGKPVGLAFRRDQDRGVSGLCDWCHCVGNDVGLLTLDKNSKKRIGVLLCRDLSCAAKIQQAADLSGTNPDEPKRQHLERVRRFAREGIGIHSPP